jgi:hypothetical protein
MCVYADVQIFDLVNLVLANKQKIFNKVQIINMQNKHAQKPFAHQSFAHLHI